jgi:hypothetical protein
LKLVSPGLVVIVGHDVYEIEQGSTNDFDVGDLLQPREAAMVSRNVFIARCSSSWRRSHEGGE